MLEKLKDADLGPVVVLNDFFLDRIISVSDVGSFYSQILEKINFGGSIRDIPQRDIKGGNATNVAFALARLGVPVTLITISDKAGAALIRETFSGMENARLLVIDGKPGRTTALEFQNGSHIVNIMFSDLGDNASFGPDKLGKEELDAIMKAETAIVTNWASNAKGTELAKFTFEKSKGALHILDPADIQTRSKEFKEALGKIGPSMDSLCINENECNILLAQYGLAKASGTEDTKKLVMELSKKSAVPVDLHGISGSYWTDGKEVSFAKAFPVRPLVVTGAGDVWDAANAVGYMADLEAEDRLLFANAASALYISNPKGLPPTLDEALTMARE
ncbi:MAG TPA: PfkB family carbohydrate kinase [Candidatus Nitrosotalea sp.]|nr:PfkB family carbohydrate kinase [Candidatus Nitrosotalea sp.]